jgi:hypothetical protein
VAATINVVMGLEPDLRSSDLKYGVCIRYFTPQPGKLLEIRNIGILKNENIYNAEIYFKPGDAIPMVMSSSDRSGHVIVLDTNVKSAIKRAEEIVSGVKFITE